MKRSCNLVLFWCYLRKKKSIMYITIVDKLYQGKEFGFWNGYDMCDMLSILYRREGSTLLSSQLCQVKSKSSTCINSISLISVCLLKGILIDHHRLYIQPPWHDHCHQRIRAPKLTIHTMNSAKLEWSHSNHN